TWTQLLQGTQGSGDSSVTQATFWSFRSGAGDEAYKFSFHQDGCGSGSAAAPASAVVARYTGIDPDSPIDDSAGTTAGSTSVTFQGSAPPTNWTSRPAPMTFDGTNTSRTWGSADEFVSLQSSCLSTSVDVCNDMTVQAPGTLTTVRFDFGTAPPDGSNYT